MMTRSERPGPPAQPSGIPPDPESLAAFGRISAELLHDLSGMLATLSGRVSLASEQAERGRIPSDELPLIKKDTDDLLRMVSEILDELRGAKGSPEVSFPLRASVESTVDRWMHTAPSVNTILHASLDVSAQVAGPASFFSRALWNLLRNAGRHAQSRIRLTLESDPEADTARLLIEDDGEGVDPDFVEHMFTPFTKGDHGGMGLGLSFGRWALERLGGSLEHTGNSGDLGGAAFLVRIPLLRVPTETTHRRSWTPRKASTDMDRPLQGLRLVLVDDEPALLSVLARVLRRAGAQVDEVDARELGSAEALMAVLCEMSPDVLLLDLNLGGFTSLDAFPLLRRDRPDLFACVLLLTGGIEPDPLPDRPVVHKLAEWEELFREIRTVADGRRGPGDP